MDQLPPLPEVQELDVFCVQLVLPLRGGEVQFPLLLVAVPVTPPLFPQLGDSHAD